MAEAYSFQQGDVIDGYRIINHIGSGGIGDVYLALHPKLPRKVALKFLKPELSSDQTIRGRFFREAQITAELAHPNICAVEDYSFSDQYSYLVMPYIDGLPIRRWLAVEPRPLKRFLTLCLEVLSALGAAHERGFVHRDITPGNILVDHYGVAKVLDFGFAKVIRLIDSDAETPEQLSLSGSIIGTPLYMAPEQLKGYDVDGRADIYGVGAVMYDLLCSVPPVNAGSIIAFIADVLKGNEVKDPRLHNSRIPDRLAEIILKCLAHDPNDRFQTVRELERALSPVANSLPENVLVTSVISVGPTDATPAMASELIPDVSIVDGIMTTEKHTYILAVALRNGGSLSASYYEARVWFPSEFLFGSPSHLIDQSLSNATHTCFSYPTAPDAAAEIPPSTSRPVVECAFTIDEALLASSDALSKNVEVQVRTPAALPITLSVPVSQLHRSKGGPHGLRRRTAAPRQRKRLPPPWLPKNRRDALRAIRSTSKRAYMECSFAPSIRLDYDPETLLAGAELAEVSGRPQLIAPVRRDDTVLLHEDGCRSQTIKRVDFLRHWSLSAQGDFYYVENFAEADRSTCSVADRIERIAQTVVYASRLYNALYGTKEPDKTAFETQMIRVRFSFSGFRGRHLVPHEPAAGADVGIKRSSFTRYLDLQRCLASEDEASVDVEFSPVLLTDRPELRNLLHIVQQIAAPFFLVFDSQVVPYDFYEAELKSFRNSLRSWTLQRTEPSKPLI